MAGETEVLNQIEKLGCKHPTFGEARCSARPLPITQRADDIPAETQRLMVSENVIF